MLTKTGPNAVESDEGFSVRRTGRNSLEYRSGQRLVKVEVEPGKGLAIYGQTIRSWEYPSGDEPITAQQRNEILDNIASALAFLGVDYVIV